MFAFIKGYEDKNGNVSTEREVKTPDAKEIAEWLLDYAEDFMVSNWDDIILRGEKVTGDKDTDGDTPFMAVWSDDRVKRLELLEIVCNRVEERG